MLSPVMSGLEFTMSVAGLERTDAMLQSFKNFSRRFPPDPIPGNKGNIMSISEILALIKNCPFPRFT